MKKDTLVLNIQNKQTKLFEWENNSLGKSKKIVGIFQKKIVSEWISHKSFENFFAKNVKGVISIEIQFLNIKKKLRKSEKVK